MRTFTRFFFIFLFFVGLAPQALAQYRVFRLLIKDSQSGASRTLLTNLDPDQYPGYYQVRKTEVVSIQSTWMCWDRTDGAPYCPEPPPRAPASAQKAASGSSTSATKP